MCRNKLSLNLQKTEYMIIIHKRKDNIKFNITTNSHLIQRKDHVKYLGMIIDEKLFWKKHIDKVRSKMVQGTWAIARLCNYVNKKKCF